MTVRSAAILWTGGKDSTLAWLRVREELDVRELVTFVPEPRRPFLAHPLECARAQARAIDIPHTELVVREPYESGYEEAIETLAERGIEVLVTGDMDRVHGHDSWIVERARGRAEVLRPLWQADRIEVLRELALHDVQAVCTLARNDTMARELVGKVLDTAVLENLVAEHGRDGFDACGENGEFHTCVLWAPGFRQRLELATRGTEDLDWATRLVIEGVTLAPLERP